MTTKNEKDKCECGGIKNKKHFLTQKHLKYKIDVFNRDKETQIIFMINNGFSFEFIDKDIKTQIKLNELLNNNFKGKINNYYLISKENLYRSLNISSFIYKNIIPKLPEKLPEDLEEIPPNIPTSSPFE